MLTCVDAGEIGSAQVVRWTVGVVQCQDRHSIGCFLFLESHRVDKTCKDQQIQKPKTTAISSLQPQIKALTPRIKTLKKCFLNKKTLNMLKKCC